jgi:hypothetical protein
LGGVGSAIACLGRIHRFERAFPGGLEVGEGVGFAGEGEDGLGGGVAEEGGVEGGGEIDFVFEDMI